MKKIWIAVIAAVLICAMMTACGGNSSANQQSTETQSNTVNHDPYATENRYDIPEEMFQKHSGTDYGTLLKDVRYYSTIAQDDKMVNILLPAGYDENLTIP